MTRRREKDKKANAEYMRNYRLSHELPNYVELRPKPTNYGNSGNSNKSSHVIHVTPRNSLLHTHTPELRASNSNKSGNSGDKSLHDQLAEGLMDLHRSWKPAKEDPEEDRPLRRRRGEAWEDFSARGGHVEPLQPVRPDLDGSEEKPEEKEGTDWGLILLVLVLLAGALFFLPQLFKASKPSTPSPASVERPSKAGTWAGDSYQSINGVSR